MAGIRKARVPMAEQIRLINDVYYDENVPLFRKNGYRKSGTANSHFLRPAGPHFPASQGHIKRSALEIGRARGAPPC